MLLSAPEGTVLHTGAATAQTGLAGLALGRLSMALEKCLFFGAAGAAPDFWRVLQWARTDCSAAAAATGDPIAKSAALGDDGDIDRVQDEENFQLIGKATGAEHLNGAECEGGGLVGTVCCLMRVHTGHGRCRAWVRGLLGLEGASAEAGLRNAVAAAARERAGIGTEVANLGGGAVSPQVHVDTVVASPRSSRATTASNEHANESKDPDAGGGSGRGGRDGGDGSNARPVASLDNAHVDPLHTLSSADQSRPTPPHFLPLWLRPGPQGASVVENVCVLLRELSHRLHERDLAIRPSLDHAWLDRENVAALTTYTWPRFPKDRLRCYVRDAGFEAAVGEYVPAWTRSNDEGEDDDASLVLVGPNGCQILRQVCSTDDEQISLVGATTASERSKDNLIQTPRTSTVTIPSREPADQITREAVVGPAPAPALVVPLWCLVVPESAPGSKKRIVYYSQGNGALPPCRGWRATDAAGAPAPVFVFGTRNADGPDTDNADQGDHSAADNGKDEEVLLRSSFRAAIAPTVDANFAMVDPTGTRSVASDSAVEATLHPVVGVAAGGCVTGRSMDVSATEQVHGGTTSSARSWPRRVPGRRKRRRPPELAAVRAMREVDGTDSFRAAVKWDDTSGGEVSLVWPRASDGDSAFGMGGDGVDSRNYAVAAMDGGDGDQDVAAFKSQPWRLPELGGDLLLRAERTRQQLLRTAEVCVVVFMRHVLVWPECSSRWCEDTL